MLQNTGGSLSGEECACERLAEGDCRTAVVRQKTSQRCWASLEWKWDQNQSQSRNWNVWCSSLLHYCAHLILRHFLEIKTKMLEN